MSSDLDIVQNLIKDYTKDDAYITITELLEFDTNGNFVGLTNTYNNILDFYKKIENYDKYNVNMEELSVIEDFKYYYEYSDDDINPYHLICFSNPFDNFWKELWKHTDLDDILNSLAGTKYYDLLVNHIENTRIKFKNIEFNDDFTSSKRHIISNKIKSLLGFDLYINVFNKIVRYGFHEINRTYIYNGEIVIQILETIFESHEEVLKLIPIYINVGISLHTTKNSYVSKEFALIYNKSMVTRLSEPELIDMINTIKDYNDDD